MQDATTTDAEVTVVEPTEVETEEVAEGTPVAGQIFEQSPDTYLASTMMDAVIMNAADEEIGDVNDMVLGADGQVEGVVIGVGGFLGVGEKNVAIELSRLEISEEENGELTFMLDATAEELEAAPAFVTAEEERREAEASAARNMPGTMSTPTTTPPATVAPPATTAN
ncbi:PRC-barrel domain-containing protein [Acuticoccus sp.]|uniref:PRC-barrel domain-containing protein n=1 Tax=Acuticoccus sp. TaxID=1904378 RepID=UPI003B51599B